MLLHHGSIVPSVLTGVKPVTNEPWARDLRRFENSYDRIAGRFNVRSRTDFQSRILTDTAEYHEFIKEQRFKRKMRGSTQLDYDEYIQLDPEWFHA